jgi:hypothetical protein
MESDRRRRCKCQTQSRRVVGQAESHIAVRSENLHLSHTAGYIVLR